MFEGQKSKYQFIFFSVSFLGSRRVIQIIGLAIATLFSIGLFSYFPSFSQESVTVRFLVQAGEATQFASFAEDFNQKNPNITLEIVRGPNNTNLVEDLYTSAFLLGDSPYDIVYMDIVWVQKFAAAGWLADLSPWVDPNLLTPYLEGVTEGGRYQDKLYRMPLRADGGMLYYRTDLLKEIGVEPPATFADLFKISKQIQDKGLAQWGYVWQGKQYEGLSAMFTEVLEGFGGFWVDPETNEVGLDKPEAIAAVEFLRQTITEGISPEDVTTYSEEESRLLFQSGNTVFLRNWPYVVPLANQSQIANKFSIKPMVHAPGLNSGACLGGWGFGISSNSPHQEEAWKVIEYFNTVDVQREYFLKTGFVPGRRSLFLDAALVTKYPHYPQLLEVINNSVLRPPIAQYAQTSDILQRYLSAVLTGSQTPEAAMQAAARETRTLLGGKQKINS
ncbi:ABC transporter substrate-binding protein [Limnoraphis robusta]|uniref:ABC transporter substrate-binding protein n=1 Tax=Limnoraphis robusta CS-951 TaxID=1637645 RepID=A0A0F5YJE2_9CYAN|nr:ABC transporter substrate-binding protein [Limnoraphis robusta]KKD38883.1 ABC transporter substrate-binding protein [Limnoraphis robusta CS-951]